MKINKQPTKKQLLEFEKKHLQEKLEWIPAFYPEYQVQAYESQKILDRLIQVEWKLLEMSA